MEQRAGNASPRSNAGRSAYVAEQLDRAMFELLREKPLSEISVSELCGAAGVGRTSFYRRYREKEDIVRAHVEGMLRGWADRWGAAPGLPVRELVRMVFSHFEANREFYALLNERGLVCLLKEVILELCGFDPEQELSAAYASAYAAFFLYGWIEVWFRRGMRDTAEELADCLPR